MRAAFQTLMAGISLTLVCVGVYNLEVFQDPSRGYGLLLLGACLLVALPDAVSLANCVWARWPVIASLGVAGVGLCTYVATTVAEHPKVSGQTQLGLWIVGGVSLVCAGYLWERRRHPEPSAPLFDRVDWCWIFGLFIAGSATRILNLAVEPPGLAADETWPLGFTLQVAHGADLSAFWTDFVALSGLFHHVAVFSLRHLGWLGLDVVQTAKLPGVLFGGCSIAMVYATARLLGPRSVAATAGVLLLWGWHWLLSRFYYAYAGDLAWVALTTALLVAGLRSGRLHLLAAAGWVTAIGVSWLKTAVMVAPWAVVVLLEYVITARGTGRKRVMPVAVWGVTFAVCLLPLVAQLKTQSGATWRFDNVRETRARGLQQEGLTSPQGYIRGLLQVATVLQLHAPRDRHVVRGGQPILDMVFSAMAAVGFFWCVRWFPRDRAARLCLLGFLLFLWPAVSAYPVDGVAALSRRMAASSLFLAWMAANGASIVAGRIAPKRLHFAGMLAIAAASATLNLYYIRTIYNRQIGGWYDEMSVDRVYFVRALREAVQIGPVFFRPTFFTDIAKHGVSDSPNLTLVNSPTELREGLLKHKGEMCVVILPWPTAAERGGDAPAWIDQLADVIPSYYWGWGPADLLGIPVYRIAYIRPS